MRRLRFIGDSHLAAIKLGWDAQAAAGVTPQFFAGPGKQMGRLTVVDGALVPPDAALAAALGKTSGGDTKIAGDADCYVVYALELGVTIALELSRKHRAERHARDWRMPLSDECFVEAVMGAARDTIALRTATKLRTITEAPILLCPTPLAEGKNERLRDMLKKTGDAADLARLFGLACDRLAAEFGGRYVPQPAETLDDDGIATKASYAATPARFFGQQAQEDRSHMSAEYGTAMLRPILAAAG